MIKHDEMESFRDKFTRILDVKVLPDAAGGCLRLPEATRGCQRSPICRIENQSMKRLTF
jgi:hypothetical protein